MTSLAYQLGAPGQANYAAAKGGIVGLSRVLSTEWALFNISVNVVAPGFIDTPMTAAAMTDEVKKIALERITLARMGTPEEVADLHLFLASEEAGYITGQVIFLDGGASIGI